MEFVANERTSTIRYPSIANLMIDSADRTESNFPLCNDFQITKNNSLLNGFFTRVGATEVVFEWNTPNVSAVNGGNSVTYSTTGTLPFFEITEVPIGSYTVADLLNLLVNLLNTEAYFIATGLTWSVSVAPGGGAILEVTGGVDGNTVTLISPLIGRLTGGSNTLTAEFAAGLPTRYFLFTPNKADLRPARYVDIVCNQLTNNQSVKDASTAPNVRDVLVRWYFDFDNQNPSDEYGFPILMGYNTFCLRRLYNPPKQIQWQTNIPIGNLSFQLYGDSGLLQTVNTTTQFLLTLQVSEN